jgi:hypothetical protein
MWTPWSTARTSLDIVRDDIRRFEALVALQPEPARGDEMAAARRRYA